jgi:dihydroorotate dehydrogenase electron transfer subunit
MPLSAGEVRGREAGPAQALAIVRSVERRGAYWHLVADAPAIADRAEPGQFVEIKVDRRGAILRRPFSIASVDHGAVEVVFDAHGLGTYALADLEPGETVDIVGPLGSSYSDVGGGVRLLVGGGYGVAPLGFLADRLATAGGSAVAIVGAATKARLPDTAYLEARVEQLVVTTDDGTLGRLGLVTDAMPEVLEAYEVDAVHACGPMPMLSAVGKAATDAGLPAQLAVEEHMACGVGICWTCVVPIRDNGAVHNRRACIDGPVFDAAVVEWDQTRWART